MVPQENKEKKAVKSIHSSLVGLEEYHYCCHVICAAFVYRGLHQYLRCVGERSRALILLEQEVRCLLVREDIPHSIAGHNQHRALAAVGQVCLGDIRCGDHEVFHAVVAEAARDCQDAEHSVARDEAARHLDALLLHSILRAVVESEPCCYKPTIGRGHLLSEVRTADQHCPAVAHICDVQASPRSPMDTLHAATARGSISSQQYRHCGRAGCVNILLLGLHVCYEEGPC
mmetsp:Transcript_10560/g.23454  ORF Transcript_10560/g.23454 Transcript_10560/m.23454 type:complete len:230 (-) Transcript_10560:460-1149(-)